MTYETDFVVGEIVRPVICPEVEMIVDAIQLSPETRYHCNWFVEGKIEDSWFGVTELQRSQSNKSIGFRKKGRT